MISVLTTLTPVFAEGEGTETQDPTTQVEGTENQDPTVNQQGGSTDPVAAPSNGEGLLGDPQTNDPTPTPYVPPVDSRTGTVVINNVAAGETFKIYQIMYRIDDPIEDYAINDAYKDVLVAYVKDKTGASENPNTQQVIDYIKSLDVTSKASGDNFQDLAAALNEVAATQTPTKTTSAADITGSQATLRDIPYGWYLVTPDVMRDKEPVVFSMGPVNNATSHLYNKYTTIVPYLYVRDSNNSSASSASKDETTFDETLNHTDRKIWRVNTNSTFPASRKSNITVANNNNGINQHAICFEIPQGVQNYTAGYPMEIKIDLENLRLRNVRGAGTPSTSVSDNPDFFMLIGNTEVPVWFADYKDSPNPDVYLVTDAYSAGSSDFTGGGSQTATLYIKDLNKIKTAPSSTQFVPINPGDSVRIFFTTVLTNDAVEGEAGNSAKVQVKFAEDPQDVEQLGGPLYTDSVMAETKTYTNKVVVNKLDAHGEPLTGSSWRLRNTAASTNPQYPTLTNEDPTFTFHGLDLGTYELSEVTAPTNYTAMSPNLVFTISATAKSDASSITYNNLAITINSGPKDGPTGYYMNENGNGKSDLPGFVTLSEGKVKFLIKNYRRNEMPSTGGVGLWTVAGIASIALLGFIVTATIKKKVTG